MKINVDAPVSPHENFDIAAAVCRSEQAEFLGAPLFVIHGLSDLSSLEAVACREALSLAEHLELHQLHIASDCKNVIKHIHESSGGVYGGVIKDIKSWCGTSGTS